MQVEHNLSLWTRPANDGTRKRRKRNGKCDEKTLSLSDCNWFRNLLSERKNKFVIWILSRFCHGAAAAAGAVGHRDFPSGESLWAANREMLDSELLARVRRSKMTLNGVPKKLSHFACAILESKNKAQKCLSKRFASVGITKCRIAVDCLTSTRSTAINNHRSAPERTNSWIRIPFSFQRLFSRNEDDATRNVKWN